MHVTAGFLDGNLTDLSSNDATWSACPLHRWDANSDPAGPLTTIAGPLAPEIKEHQPSHIPTDWLTPRVDTWSPRERR